MSDRLSKVQKRAWKNGSHDNHSQKMKDAWEKGKYNDVWTEDQRQAISECNRARKGSQMMDDKVIAKKIVDSRV